MPNLTAHRDPATATAIAQILTAWEAVDDDRATNPGLADEADAAALALLQQIGVLAEDDILDQISHSHDDQIWLQVVDGRGQGHQAYASTTTGQIAWSDA